MPIEEFLALVQRQCDRLTWIHLLGDPASSDDLASVPPCLHALYARANGGQLHRTLFQGEIVGAALEILPAAEIEPLATAMYGRAAPAVESLPRDWLAICRASDAAFFIALDPTSERYFSVAPIVPDEAELLAASTQAFYQWLADQLPSDQQLKAAQGR